MVKILSADIQIVDKMVKLKTPEQLDELDSLTRQRYENLNALIKETLEDKKIKRGQKAALDEKEFLKFKEATEGLIPEGLVPTEFAGGSSANTLTTLCKTLNKEGDPHKKIEVNLLGVVGNTKNDKLIRDSLEEAGVNLIPKEYKSEIKPESATSFVFQEEDGKRTIFTYPGNAKKILTEDMITPELVATNDVLFFQASLCEKIEEHVALKLFESFWEKDKEICLALPTHAKFRDNMLPERYQELIPKANVVMANSEELMRIYETNGNLEAAIKLLQDALSWDSKMTPASWAAKEAKKSTAEEPPVKIALITLEEKGAYLVTPSKIIEIAPSDVSKINKLYLLGAGDASYAGFLAGHIAGLDPVDSAKFAMQVAGTNLKFESARIPNPRQDVPEFSEIGANILGHIDANLSEKRSSNRSTGSLMLGA